MLITVAATNPNTGEKRTQTDRCQGELHPSGYGGLSTEFLACRRGVLSEYWSGHAVWTLGMVGDRFCAAGGSGALCDKGSVTTFDALTPTASVELHLLKGASRFTFRYGYSFYWISADPEDAENESSYDDVTLERFTTFSRERLAHTLGFSIKF